MAITTHLVFDMGNMSVREVAAEALKKIDPDAAHRVVEDGRP